MGGQFSIPEPEPIEPRPEFPPVTQPPLVDQEPADWPEPEGFTWVDSDPIDEIITPDDIERVRERVYDDPRVQDALGGDRPIGVDPTVIEPKESSEPPLLVFLLYSCASRNSVEVTVDLNSMDIINLQSVPTQPPLTPQELVDAVSLGGQAVGVTYGPDLVGRAMGITVHDPSHELFGHRLADVRIGNPENRLPRHFALVDLCDGSVIDAGDVS